MDHLLTCSCGETHVVTRSQAGQEITCKCGTPIAVPTLRGLADLPPAKPAEGHLSPLGKRRNWRNPVMALVIAGFILSLAFSGWNLWTRSRIDTSYTVQDEIKVGEEYLESLDPHALSLSWDNFQKTPLTIKSRPGFFHWNNYALDLESKAKRYGIAAGIFAIVGLALWFSGRGTPSKKN
jgi:hypothetical protein